MIARRIRVGLTVLSVALTVLTLAVALTSTVDQKAQADTQLTTASDGSSTARGHDASDDSTPSDRWSRYRHDVGDDNGWHHGWWGWRGWRQWQQRQADDSASSSTPAAPSTGQSDDSATDSTGADDSATGTTGTDDSATGTTGTDDSATSAGTGSATSGSSSSSTSSGYSASGSSSSSAGSSTSGSSKGSSGSSSSSGSSTSAGSSGSGSPSSSGSGTTAQTPTPVSSAGVPDGGLFPLLPPGATLPSDQECAARVQRNAWEPRPENATANKTKPAGAFPFGMNTWTTPQADGANYRGRVTGNFTGTTDEIIQWASCKWGFPTDIDRAQAVVETTWRQSVAGDNGESRGLYQMRMTVWGGYPNSAASVAFNADWAMGLRRACYDGTMWYPQLKGNLEACIGVHYSGDPNEGSWRAYTDAVLTAQRDKPWLSWPSATGGQAPVATRKQG